MDLGLYRGFIAFRVYKGLEQGLICTARFAPAEAKSVI